MAGARIVFALALESVKSKQDLVAVLVSESKLEHMVKRVPHIFKHRSLGKRRYRRRLPHWTRISLLMPRELLWFSG